MEFGVRRFTAIAAVLAGIIGSQASAEDLTIDRLLASQCAQCHGTNGYPVGDIEELAGESFAELVEEMLEMRSEDPPEDIMDHQALGYTEAQIRRIARYFSSLPGTLDSEDDEGPEDDDDDD